MIGAFGDERYWLAWLAAEYGTDATLDTIQVGADGSVEGACTFALPQDQLPSVVTRVYKSDVQITRGESWSAIAGGGATCTITASMPGTPVTLSGSAQLTPHPADAGGAQMRVEGMVEVRIPEAAKKPAFGVTGVEAGVGPFVGQGAVESLYFAIGLGSVGSGATVYYVAEGVAKCV